MAQKRSCNLAPSDIPGTDEMPGDSMIGPEDSSSDTRLPASIQAMHRLTGREREVLDLLAAGLTNIEISERLFISSHTVAQHVAAMLKRTNCRRRTQLAVLAARAGILTDGGIGVPPAGQPVGQGTADILYGN
jgi:DNA-binding CsgD family transcriptional regulator